MVLNFRAIITGVVIDLVGSIAGGILVVVLYSAMMTQGNDNADAVEKILKNPANSDTLIWMLILVGIFFDGLAGHITAKIAGFLEYWHVLAMLGLLLVVQYTLRGDSVFASWVQFVGLTGGTSAAFLMAYRVKRTRRIDPPQD